jgi:purine nucleosidase
MLKCAAALLIALLLAVPALAAKRLLIIDQDAAGPGGTDQQSMLLLLQSPDVEVLGITVVTGDQWRDEEVQHTLRMLELVGRTDVPVVPGAAFPLMRTQEETGWLAERFGTAPWLGAWSERPEFHPHGPWEVPQLREGIPRTRPLDEDAAHFLIRQVHAHPHKVTIYAAGPLTNIALALAIDPHFAEMTQGIVIMGGSVNPQTDDPEFTTRPSFEFNFWFDPEATHMVLRAKWPRIDVTTIDISVQAKFTQPILDAIKKSPNPAAQYVARYSEARSYLWDELAACAWLDPKIIKKELPLYMDVDLGHGARYGETIAWSNTAKPNAGAQLVHAQMEVDLERFTKVFVDLLSAPAPKH